MKLFLPKQHGAWAMLIIPFWLGVISTSFVWGHIPFFIGWLFLYLATYPMLLLFKKNKQEEYKKWTIIYLVPAIIFLLVPLILRPSIIYFGLAMIPFFILNAYYSRENNDRAFLNDLSAIIVFCIAGLASGYLSSGQLGKQDLISFMSSFLFFTGCTFYVKTMIREKHSQFYKKLSWLYHVLIPVVFLALGEWVIAVAFLPSLYRAISFYGKPYSIIKIGIVEILNATIFFIIMAFSIKL